MKKAILISSLLFITLFMTSCSTEPSEDLLIPINNVETLESPKSIEIEILELINAYRATKNLPILLHNEQIRTQTTGHTNYMMANHSASHDNFFERKNYLMAHANAKTVSENVAVGYSSAESVVKAWLNSESHRLNIEAEHTHFNVTAERCENNKWYFTNIFIKTNH